MKRRRRKKRSPSLMGKVMNGLFIFGIIVCVILNAGLYMYRNAYPYVMAYAKSQLLNISTYVIRQGIAESDVVSFDINEALLFEENEGGEIESIVINTPLLNQLLVSTTERIEEKLLLVETGDFSKLDLSTLETGPLKGDVFIQVPLFAAFNLSLLHQYGPKVPVGIDIVGHTQTDVVTNVREYGINNALFEILLDIKVKMHVQLPFKSEELEVNVHSPLIVKMINGPIPEYYYIGNSSASPSNPSNQLPGRPDSGPELDTSEGMENILMQ